MYTCEHQDVDEQKVQLAALEGKEPNGVCRFDANKVRHEVVLQCGAACVAVWCIVVQSVIVWCSVVQCVAVCCSVKARSQMVSVVLMQTK